MEHVTIEEPVRESWVKDAIKKGLILALIHIIVFVSLYFLASSKLTGFSYLFFILVLNLGYSIFHSIQFRKAKGGYIGFATVFKYVFVLLTASGLIQIVFFVIFLLIEPGYPTVMADSQLDTSLYWAQKFGAPQEALDKLQTDFDHEKIVGRYSLSGIPFSFGIGLIFYCLGAVIVALIVRKNMPEKF